MVMTPSEFRFSQGSAMTSTPLSSLAGTTFVTAEEASGMSSAVGSEWGETLTFGSLPPVRLNRMASSPSVWDLSNLQSIEETPEHHYEQPISDDQTNLREAMIGNAEAGRPQNAYEFVEFDQSRTSASFSQTRTPTGTSERIPMFDNTGSMTKVVRQRLKEISSASPNPKNEEAKSSLSKVKAALQNVQGQAEAQLQANIKEVVEHLNRIKGQSRRGQDLVPTSGDVSTGTSGTVTMSAPTTTPSTFRSQGQFRIPPPLPSSRNISASGIVVGPPGNTPAPRPVSRSRTGSLTGSFIDQSASSTGSRTFGNRSRVRFQDEDRQKQEKTGARSKLSRI